MSTNPESGPPLVIVIGRGHSGTRAFSRTLSESGVYMGASLNASYDLVPAGGYGISTLRGAKHGCIRESR